MLACSGKPHEVSGVLRLPSPLNRPTFRCAGVARGGKGVDTESGVSIGKIREECVDVPFVSDALLEDAVLERKIVGIQADGLSAV